MAKIDIFDMTGKVVGETMRFSASNPICLLYTP